MKKTITLTLLAAGSMLFGFQSQAQGYSWANRVTIGNQFMVYPPTVGADKLGNSYMIGNYSSANPSGNAAIFGITSLITLPYNHTNEPGNLNDLFIVKFNSAGLPQWAKQGQSIGKGGSGNQNTPTGLFVDSVGNSYMIASPMDSMQFGSVVVPDKGYFSNGNGCIVKYNSAGTVKWAKALTSAGDCYGLNITGDASGNSYVTGYIYNSTSGSTFGTTNLNTPVNTGLYYIAKYDTAGVNVWASAVDSMNYIASPSEYAGIAVDANHNVYHTATAGNGAGSNTKFWVAQYSPTGVQNWQTIVRGSANSNMNARNIAADAAGNTYVAGSFTGSFIMGTTTLTATSNSDIFITKLDASGNFVWAKSIAGAANNQNGYGISLDGTGNIYVSGNYSGTVNFGANSLTSVSGNVDVFVAKFNNSGTNLWALGSSGTATSQVGYSVASGLANSLFVGGIYGGSNGQTGIFGTTTLTNASGFLGSYFIAHVDETVGLNELKTNETAVVMYPNPASGALTIVLGSAFEKEGTVVTIYDVTGRVVNTLKNDRGTPAQVFVDAGSLTNGVYFVQVTSGANCTTKKLVVNH